MLYLDHDLHRQLARERADELARDYRRAQRHGEERSQRERRRLSLEVLARLRRRRPDRAHA